MRDPGQVNEHLGPQVVQPHRQRTLIAGIQDVQRHAALPEQVQSLIDHGKIEFLVPRIVVRRGEGQQVVHLEAIDDRHLGTLAGERQGEVVADEPGAADKRDSSLLQRDHVTSPRQWLL